MPDLLTQLHDYGDALAARVEPVDAATAITTDARRPLAAPARRARWSWRVAAVAATVLVVLTSFVAIQARDGHAPVLSGWGLDGELDGRTFRAVAMRGADGNVIDAAGTMRFTDGRLELELCNRSSIGYTLDGDHLVLAGPGISTAMGCSDGPPGTWLAIVWASPRVSLDGDRLTLAANSATVELTDDPSAPEPDPEPIAAEPVDPAALAGRTFVGTTISEDGADRLLVGSGAAPPRVFLNFRADGLLTVSAGCNAGTSRYEVVDGRLHGGAITTETACAQAGGDEVALVAQDAELNRFLASAPTLTLDGNRLRLASATTALELQDQEAWMPSAGIEGVRWVLVATVSGSIETPIGDLGDASRAPSLHLAPPESPEVPTRQLQVNDGCNTGGAYALIDATTIELGALRTTQALCAETRTAVAERFRAVLQDRVTYEVDGTTLTVRRFDEALVFTSEP